MSPFMALTLIGFAAVIVLALLVWSILAPPARPRRTPEPAADPRTARPARPTVSNDEVRGARVRPPERRRGDDAFERFLRSEPDDR